MSGSISRHVHANLVAYVALFFAISGGSAAYALDGSNTVFSDDLVNGEVTSADLGTGEVKAPDLGADAVTTGRIRNGHVKAADLGADAVRSTDILDGQVRGADVADGGLSGDDVAGLTGGDLADDSLKGDDVDEASLGKVPSADQLDGIDSDGFIRGGGRALGGSETVPEGASWYVVSPGGDTPFIVAYECPQDSSNNGRLQFFNWGPSVKLFVHNGSGNPSFIGDLGTGQSHYEPAAASGEYITFQARYPDGRIVTVDAFSQHDPAGDSCYAQAQAVVTKP